MVLFLWYNEELIYVNDNGSDYNIKMAATTSKQQQVYPVSEINAVHIWEGTEYPTSFFALPDWPLPYLESVLIPNGMIKDRIEKLAEDIYKAYRTASRLTIVIVMTVYLFYLLLNYFSLFNK